MDLNNGASYSGQVGLGISDISPEYRGDLKLVDREGLSVLELQPEMNTWNPWPMKRRYRFLTVHASSQGRDIASPDPDHRAFAVEEHKQNMLFAHAVGADALLIHPGHILSPGNVAGISVRKDYPFTFSYYMQHPRERMLRLQMFQESLTSLVEFYQREDLGFQITIENLPFPNLGATFSEFVDLFRLAGRYWPVKMTVDVPHLWVSRLLLRECPHLQPMTERGAELHDSFYEELERFLGDHGKDVLYYHISGVDGTKEHLPVSLKRRYKADELDLRRVAHIIGSYRPVILEVFNAPWPEVRRSLRNFQELIQAA